MHELIFFLKILYIIFFNLYKITYNAELSPAHFKGIYYKNFVYFPLKRKEVNLPKCIITNLILKLLTVKIYSG